MNSFKAKVYKIGINPYVLMPAPVLNKLFRQAGKYKSPIPVKGTLNGNEFIQTIVKYSGKWRLYLNTPMCKAAGIDVGDMAIVEIAFDATLREILMHPKLLHALGKNKIASDAFKSLSPYRRKEIARYITSLKTEKSVDRNVAKAILQLAGKNALQQEPR